MSPSKRIAGLVGPTLIALTVSETVNLDIWKTNDPRVTYLNGLLLFTGGLAIVRAHNVWVCRWPVLLTLVGWLAMAAGLFRMFAPKAPQGGENPNGKRIRAFQVAKLRDRRPQWFREDAGALFELLKEGKIEPIVAERIPLTDARRAHENLGRGGVTGKQVLICDERAMAGRDVQR